ncbi:hypothetical protein EBS02_09830, partial [bacterium]|nr:hypothetical protein [bacterium]
MSKHHSPCASLSLKAHATAAGKTILFGEYAVIFGHKAYVQALPLRTHCLLKVMPTCTDFGIKLNLLNLGLTQTRSYQQLYDQYQAIKIQYSRFLAKEIPISHVLTEPSALMAAVLIEGFDDFFDGIEVVIASDVMPQSGQGSSAALIVSALLAINTLKNKKYRLDDIFHQAVKLECFQHGISSGLDVAASLYGGLASYQNKKFKPLSLPAFKFYLISTGKPFSTTG